MKKQSAPICILAAAILVSAVLIALRLPGRSAGQSALSPADSYRLEKLNQVCDLVLERQVVPEDYLRYLDDDLAQAVEGYNHATGYLKMEYSYHLEGTVEGLLYALDGAPEDPGNYWRPERYYQMVDRMSALALFRNSHVFYQTDPVLSFAASHEAGGSCGLWASAIHEYWYVGEDLARRAEEYFEQCDALLDRLDAARAAFGG